MLDARLDEHVPVETDAGDLLPLNPGRSLRNASGSWSMTATEWPWSSRMCASVEPTRPQPMITMCTAVPSADQRVMMPDQVMPSDHVLLAPDTPTAGPGRRHGSMGS